MKSWDLIVAIGDNPHFSPSENLVLMCLARHNNEKKGDMSWPSIATIRAWTGLGRNTIFSTLAGLTESGVIIRIHGIGVSSHYQIAYQMMVDYKPSPVPKEGLPPVPESVVPKEILVPKEVLPPYLNRYDHPYQNEDTKVLIEKTNERSITDTSAKTQQPDLLKFDPPEEFRKGYGAMSDIKDYRPNHEKDSKLTVWLKENEITGDIFFRAATELAAGWPSKTRSKSGVPDPWLKMHTYALNRKKWDAEAKNGHQPATRVEIRGIDYSKGF